MRRLVLGAIIPGLLLFVWEGSSRMGLLTLESLSRPSDIIVAGYAALRDGSLLSPPCKPARRRCLDWPSRRLSELRSVRSSA